MNNAVIIFIDGKLNYEKIELPKQGKVIVVGDKNSSIPVVLVQKFMANKNIEFEYNECEDDFKAAFLLGKYSAIYNISAVYSSNEKYKALISVHAPSRRRTKASSSKVEAKPEQIDAEQKSVPVEKAMNPPVIKTEKKETVIDKSRLSDKLKPKKSDLSKVTEAQIKKILKKYKLDDKLSGPIHEAVIASSDVTLDMMVRTRIANIVPLEKCKDIGEIFKKELL